MDAMPISGIVKQWCKEQNARSHAASWFLVLLLGLAMCAAAIWQTDAPRAAAIVAIVLVGGWFMLAPKGTHYGQLRHVYRDGIVPDGLLARIADAENVPEWIKAELAKKLKADGLVSFETLFALEGWLGRDAAREAPGFKKMVAFDAPERRE